MNQNQNVQQNTDLGREIDLLKLFGVLWKRAWILVICTVLCGALAWGWTEFFVPERYKRELKMFVWVEQGSISTSGISVAMHAVDLCGSHLRDDEFLVQVQDELDSQNRLSLSEIRGMLSYAPYKETEIFYVTVSGTDPNRVVAVANVIEKIFPDAVRKGYNDNIRVKCFEQARNDTCDQYAPNVTQNVTIGAILGFLLSAATIAVIFLIDPYVKSEEEISKVYGIPLLAVIPTAGTRDKKSYHSYGGYYGSYKQPKQQK